MNGHLRIDPWVVAGAALSAPLLGWWSLPAALGLGVAAHARAISGAHCGWYGPTHWRLPAHCPHLALTFDDGPHPEVTPRILDCLAEYQQQATFFVIGSHVQRHPQIVRRAVAEGHQLGIHSSAHDRLFALRSAQRQAADIDRCSALISDATGQAAPRLFRPPVGLRGPQTHDVLRHRDLRLVTWTASARDGTGRPAPHSLRRLRRHWQARAILVLHDGHEPAHPRDPSATVTVLAQLLSESPATLASRALVVPPGPGIDCAP